MSESAFTCGGCFHLSYRLRTALNALHAIRRHMEIISPSGAELSATVAIVDKALKLIDEHDGNAPVCGCDCEGCLGLVPGTKLYEASKDMDKGEKK